MNSLPVIEADWPAPPQVRAFTTSRAGGVSKPPFDSLNLGLHVGDDPAAVAHNRQHLAETLQLPAAPLWLNQVHGNRVLDADQWQPDTEADAVFSRRPQQVCAVMTADCLPVLLCDSAGQQVAAAHAGWRGLLNGVLENTVAQFSAGAEILAWLGPAIGPDQFEVGPEVRQAFTDKSALAAAAFRPGKDGRYLADIYQLARQRLHTLGINAIFGGDHCTVTESGRFFSYRRDGDSGRMASLIWIAHK